MRVTNQLTKIAKKFRCL